MASIHVGAGRAYEKLSAAVQAAGSGDTIYVAAGTYTNDSVRIAKDLTIVGVGGLAHLKATQPVGNGQGIIVVTRNADVVIENLELSGARVADDNGAGIRFTSGNLTIRNSYFHDNQNGLMTASDSDARLVIESSRFVANGNGDGYTHGVYAGRIGSLTIADSLFEGTDKGSHVKSRAAYTEVRDSKLVDGDGQSNYGIDLSDGNTALIKGNVLMQAADTSNRTMITYGPEADKPGTLTVVDNTLINERPLATGVYNHTDNDAVVRGNSFINVSQWIRGEATASGNSAKVSADTGDGGGSDGAAGSVDAELDADTVADGGGGSDGSPGVQRLVGSAQADTLQGGEGAEQLDGLAGNDRLDGRGGADLLRGQAGHDRLYGGNGADTLLGGDGRDKLSGGAGNDRLQGQAGNDRLTGAGGNDTLAGGDGSDVLVGGNGADALNGGAGNDVLQGGDGADRFFFAPGHGSDHIAGFELGVDKLVVGGVAPGAIDIVNSGDSALVTFETAPTTSIEVRLSAPFGDLSADDILIG